MRLILLSLALSIAIQAAPLKSKNGPTYPLPHKHQYDNYPYNHEGGEYVHEVENTVSDLVKRGNILQSIDLEHAGAPLSETELSVPNVPIVVSRAVIDTGSVVSSVDSELSSLLSELDAVEAQVEAAVVKELSSLDPAVGKEARKLIKSIDKLTTRLESELGVDA